MKKAIRVILAIIFMIVLLIATLLGYMTVDEYKPEYEENIELSDMAGNSVELNKSIKILSWNIGYGALGDNADFFMDGGNMVYTADEDRVKYNLDGICNAVDEMNPDILMLQEVDLNSSRSFFIDELEYIKHNTKNGSSKHQSAFAYNFKVSYIPYPLPPIGRVNAGLVTFSKYDIQEATRIQLPCPFKWPISAFNLKRCLEEMRLPIEDSDKELVVFNLHLEAYDDGEGKIAQTKVLKSLIETEIENGNYVIAGGDFNQVFSNVDSSLYPVLENNWEAGVVDIEEFDDSLQFVTDFSIPTCRSLSEVYADAENKDPNSYQYYVIDGFIVSGNIDIQNIETVNKEFVYSDHNPVYLEVILK